MHRVSGIVPGVMAQTGMETAEIIQGVVAETKPDVVVAIDALAARSVRRLNRTIQITDTGIHPGSGVGNHRNGLTEDNLQVKVMESVFRRLWMRQRSFMIRWHIFWMHWKKRSRKNFWKK